MSFSFKSHEYLGKQAYDQTNKTKYQDRAQGLRGSEDLFGILEFSMVRRNDQLQNHTRNTYIKKKPQQPYQQVKRQIYSKKSNQSDTSSEDLYRIRKTEPEQQQKKEAINLSSSSKPELNDSDLPGENKSKDDVEIHSQLLQGPICNDNEMEIQDVSIQENKNEEQNLKQQYLNESQFTNNVSVLSDNILANEILSEVNGSEYLLAEKEFSGFKGEISMNFQYIQATRQIIVTSLNLAQECVTCKTTNKGETRIHKGSNHLVFKSQCPCKNIIEIERNFAQNQPIQTKKNLIIGKFDNPSNNKFKVDSALFFVICNCGKKQKPMLDITTQDEFNKKINQQNQANFKILPDTFHYQCQQCHEETLIVSTEITIKYS